MAAKTTWLVNVITPGGQMHVREIDAENYQEALGKASLDLPVVIGDGVRPDPLSPRVSSIPKGH